MQAATDPSVLFQVISALMTVFAFLFSALGRTVIGKHEERGQNHADRIEKAEAEITQLKTQRAVDLAHREHDRGILNEVRSDLKIIMGKLGVQGSLPHIPPGDGQ